ncbi:hypothetical protein [Edaphobacter modestus]|uniref:hypothetical protein n=1 Tax=Edaphobacter modestus TaxID=388466 RepID=UPI00102C0895|nr:hypothetical protein [Edaphobacter modestus]
MTKVIWLRPVAVAHIDFLGWTSAKWTSAKWTSAKWTSANKLRHTTFVAMRYDKEFSKVIRET